MCCCVLLVVVCCGADLHADCLCQQIRGMNCAGALDDEELFIIEGSENWRSTPDDLEEREKWPKKAEQLFIAAIPC